MRTLFSLLLLTISLNFLAQDNLIPNPSFEDLDCPDGEWLSTSFGAAHWYNCNTATPDFYGIEPIDECGLKSIFSDDWSFWGEWQLPFEGERMIGLWAGDSQSCTRDYVQAKLNSALQQGHTYCFSMRVSLSNLSQLSTDCFGAYFHTDSLLDVTSPCLFEGVPQVENTSFQLLSDTLGWTLIEGEFLADGGEEFVTIGNVRSNTACLWEEEPGLTFNWDVAYYFVDSLNLEECTTDGIDRQQVFDVSIYPNPTDDVLFILTSVTGEGYLRDISGKLLLQVSLRNESESIDLSHFSSGVYMLEVVSDNDKKSFRVVKR